MQWMYVYAVLVYVCICLFIERSYMAMSVRPTSIKVALIVSQLAMKSGTGDVMAELLEAGADMEIREKKGMSQNVRNGASKPTSWIQLA